MTKDEAKHFSEILKAYSEGKTIQVREHKDSNIWVDTISTPDFKGNPFDYRIKPHFKEISSLKYLYTIFKRLENYYWEIFINTQNKYYETNIEIYLGEIVAYQNIWNDMYNALNNFADKLGYAHIKREVPNMKESIYKKKI